MSHATFDHLATSSSVGSHPAEFESKSARSRAKHPAYPLFQRFKKSRFARATAFAAMIACISLMPPASAQEREEGLRGNTVVDPHQSQHSWLSAGNGATNNHFASHEFILSPQTVPSLTPRWVFSANGEVQGTPTVQGNAVYASDAGGSVWRIDSHSGTSVWEVKLPAITGNPASYSRVSPAISNDAIIVGDQASATLIALSKLNGALLWKTTVAQNPYAFITSSPVVVNGRLYVGVSSNQEYAATVVPGFKVDFRGSVAALDVSNGKLLWQAFTVPEGYTGGAVWASNLAIDVRRQAVYVDTGNNYSVPSSVAACQSAAKTNSELAACLAPEDYIDSVLSLDMNTGSVKWAKRFTYLDTAIDSCVNVIVNPANPCPAPSGPDTDFGSAPNLFTISAKGKIEDIVGAGQKSGVYWALDRDSGAIVWSTQVGAGGRYGGIEYGTATDGKRIYVPEGNYDYVETTLVPSGKKTNGGYWSALDPATGHIIWQTPTPALAVNDSLFSGTHLAPPPGAFAGTYGAVSIANGVMYGEDQAGNFLALNGATGEIIYTFQSGGTSISAPAIVDGTLFWSSGYKLLGATNNKIYALGLGRYDHEGNAY